MIEKLKFYPINIIFPDINAIQESLNKGEIDINSQFNYLFQLGNVTYLFENETLLCFAVREEQLDIVRFLLSYPGVDINLGSEITSPLRISISQKNQNIFNLLLENGAIIRWDDLREIFAVHSYNEFLEITNNLLEKRFISEELYQKLAEEVNYHNDTLTLISYTPLIAKHSCLSICDTLISNTYSDLKLSSLKELYYKAYNTSLVTRDVVVGVVIKYSFNENDNKLVIFKDSKYMDYSYYNIYTRLLASTFSGRDDEAGMFVHELSHLFFALIFDNGCNPYPQQAFEMQAKYHQIGKNFLINIANDLLKVDFKDQDLENMTFTQVIEFLKDSSLLDIFVFTEFNHNRINSEGKLVNATYMKYFNGTDKQLNNQDKVKNLLEFAKNHISIDYTEEEYILLSRVSDLILRDVDEYDYEFIVRYPELQMLHLSANVMKYFEELEIFWGKYIRPEVEKAIYKHDTICAEACSLSIDTNHAVCGNNNNPFVNCIAGLWGGEVGYVA